MDDIIVQHKIITQVSRALNLAEPRNKFRNSEEQIEAERLLLLSRRRQDALKHELSALRSRNARNMATSDDKPLPCFGNITICNMSIPLNRNELFHVDLTRHNLYYVCLVRYKTQVIATQLVHANSDYNALNFASLITFRNVEPNFELSIEVWSYACVQSGATTPQAIMSPAVKGSTKKLQTSEKRKAPFLSSPFIKKAKSSAISSSSDVHCGAGKQSSAVDSSSYRQLGFKKAASLLLTKRNCSKKVHKLDEVVCFNCLALKDGKQRLFYGASVVT